MSVNRFFQPGRSQRISQFVPNQLPTNLLSNMVLRRQAAQDQARNMMLAQQAAFQHPTSFSQDEAKVKQKRAELDKFIADNFNQDLTRGGKQAEIIRYASGLKQDKELAAIDARTKNVAEFSKRVKELQEKGKLDPLLASAQYAKINEYANSNTFSLDNTLSGLTLAEKLDLHKKEESYFNNMPKLENDVLVNANNYLASKGISGNSELDDILVSVKQSGIGSDRIATQALNSLEGYAGSAEGLQAGERYDEMVRQGMVDPNKSYTVDINGQPTTLSGKSAHLFKRLYLTGMEKSGISTTLSGGLSDINKATRERNTAQNTDIYSIGNTETLFGDGIDNYEDLQNRIEEAKASSPKVASALQNKLDRARTQFFKEKEAKIPEYEKSAKAKLNGFISTRPSTTWAVRMLEKGSDLNEFFSDDDVRALSTKDGFKPEKASSLIGNDIQTQIQEVLTDPTLTEVTDEEIMKRLHNDASREYYKNNIAGREFNFGTGPSRGNRMDGTLVSRINKFRGFVQESMISDLEDFGKVEGVLQSTLVRPSDEKERKAIINDLDSAPSGEWSIMPNESDITDLNQIRNKITSVSARISGGDAPNTLEVTYKTGEADNEATVRLVPKGNRADDTYHTMLKRFDKKTQEKLLLDEVAFSTPVNSNFEVLKTTPNYAIKQFVSEDGSAVRPIGGDFLIADQIESQGNIAASEPMTLQDIALKQKQKGLSQLTPDFTMAIQELAEESGFTESQANDIALQASDLSKFNEELYIPYEFSTLEGYEEAWKSFNEALDNAFGFKTKPQALAFTQNF